MILSFYFSLSPKEEPGLPVLTKVVDLPLGNLFVIIYFLLDVKEFTPFCGPSGLDVGCS